VSKIQHRLTNAKNRLRNNAAETVALLSEASARITELEAELARLRAYAPAPISSTLDAAKAFHQSVMDGPFGTTT
jgi:uncharacterized small protein (DUF1192 family)